MLHYGIRLNTTCNLSCDHCYLYDRTQHFPENIVDDIISFFERVPDKYIDNSSFMIMGGEITLYNQKKNTIAYKLFKIAFYEYIDRILFKFNNSDVERHARYI